jgi:hypothetical protein
LHVLGLGITHLPPTHFAGCMQCAPVSVVLHVCPSGAAAVHEPPNPRLHVPAVPQTATLVGLSGLFAPHVPPDAVRVSAMHCLLVAVLQPTW